MPSLIVGRCNDHSERKYRLGEIPNLEVLRTISYMVKIWSTPLINIGKPRVERKEIDFLKTGLRWHMNKSMRNFLKQLPWFLMYSYPKKLKTYEKLKKYNKSVLDPKNKVRLNAYRSPSPMNELCDYINTWERNLIWDRSVNNTVGLIINNDLDLTNRTIIRKIRHLINDYSIELKELIKKRKQKGDEDDYAQSGFLLDSYKEKLTSIVDNEELLANYVIKTSYSNNSINKGLAWSGYGEWILKNLAANTPSRKHVSITEVVSPTNSTYEYLGKHYLFEEVSH